MPCVDDQIVEIAMANDAFRLDLPKERVIVHRTIQHWSRMCEVLDGLRVVPGGADEPMRDTGDLEVDGHRIVWKIHYYDRLGRFRCSPLDPDCFRVLTAMRDPGFGSLVSAKQIWEWLEQKNLQEEKWQLQATSMSMRQRLRKRMTTFVRLVGE